MSRSGRARPDDHPGGPHASGAVVRAVAVVSGHVQGVGYRYFVRERATAAGLTGVARNLPDGRVQVELEGPVDGVAAVVAALEGPEAPGTVRSVVSRREPVHGVRQFTTE